MEITESVLRSAKTSLVAGFATALVLMVFASIMSLIHARPAPITNSDNAKLDRIITKLDKLEASVNEKLLTQVPQNSSVRQIPAPAVKVTPTDISSTQAKVIFDREYRKKYASIDRSELLALSVVLYCEARGEPWVGIASVADTVRNRKRSNMFPNTYRAVITQHAQFSCISDPQNLYNDIEISSNGEARKFSKIIYLAKRTITGDLAKMTTNALFYHTAAVHPNWAKHYSKLGVIGNHIFYTTARL